MFNKLDVIRYIIVSSSGKDHEMSTVVPIVSVELVVSMMPQVPQVLKFPQVPPVTRENGHVIITVCNLSST